MTDASHRIAKPAPQSAALYLPPLSHTGRPPSARMVFSLFVDSFGPQPGQFIDDIERQKTHARPSRVCVFTALLLTYTDTDYHI